MVNFEFCGNCGEAMTSIRLNGLGVLFRLTSDGSLPARPNGPIDDRFPKCSLCRQCWEYCEMKRFGPGRTDAQGKAALDGGQRPNYAYAIAESLGPGHPSAWSDFIVDGDALVFVPDAAAREYLSVATVVLELLVRGATMRMPRGLRHLGDIRLPDNMSIADLLAAGDSVEGIRDAPPGLRVPDLLEDDVADVFGDRYGDDFGADSDGDIDIGMAGADFDDSWSQSPGQSQQQDYHGDCTCRDRAYFSLSKGKRRCLRRRKAEIRRTVTDPAAQKYAIDMAIARFRGIRSCTVHP